MMLESAMLHLKATFQKRWTEPAIFLIRLFLLIPLNSSGPASPFNPLVTVQRNHLRFAPISAVNSLTASVTPSITTP